jgi:hypothetical protein
VAKWKSAVSGRASWKGAVIVTSAEELHAARLSAKQLLAIVNRLSGETLGKLG